MNDMPAPTKTNLMRLKDELKLSVQGYELLDQKRNILIVELLTLVDQTIAYNEQVTTHLEKAYEALSFATSSMGRRNIDSIASAIALKTSLSLKSRRVMGVSLPVVQTETEALKPFFSPYLNEHWIYRLCALLAKLRKLYEK